MSISQWIVPAELPYPKGASQACQVEPQALASPRAGFLERFFSPAELPYPAGSRSLPPANGNAPPPVVTGDAVRLVRVSIDNPGVVASLSAERAEEVAAFAEVAHAVEVDSGPIVLSVPSGDFNKVELFFGSMVGEGADELIALGEPSIREAAVASGGTVTVTVPWKFAPWLTVPARQVLVELVAVFSKAA